MRGLEAKDLSLTAAMIPLGSCTMKLNATTEMIPVSWRPLNAIHPFAPRAQTAGYLELFRRLECSRTPARRASLLGCSRSARITTRAATIIARCA